MPTYDYKCTNCDHLFETLQSIKADRLKECPECKKETLKRLIGTGAGILFKGSGFYETDYRSSNYLKGKSKETKKSADTPSKKKPGSTGTKTT